MALIDQALPASGARVIDLGAVVDKALPASGARGHRVVAIDAVPEARTMALALAAKRGVAIDYRVGDAVRETPDGPFDLVFDRGFLHTLDPLEWSMWRLRPLQVLR
jgi:2-polyprenyl-3-methyl-5-hydroxy-6-metoxy-1,4-benzoquinol methylase